MILCRYCADHPDGRIEEPATVLAPQGVGTNLQWVPACDSHWATWWHGGDYDFLPFARQPAFYLATMKPIPVEEHPICWDWMDDKEKYCERNRHKLAVERPDLQPPSG